MLIKNLIFPVSLGLFGFSFLCVLGIWQIERLKWKNQLISEVSNSIAMEPKEIKLNKISANTQYLPVVAEGNFLDQEVHVLFSLKPYGPGFKVIKPFQLINNKIILVDIGFIKESNKDLPRVITNTKILGNIFFPNETDSFTPAPNFKKNIWFSRDLDNIASYLATEPLLIILSTVVTDKNIITTPLKPNFVNNHLQYSVTWFCMAIAWFFMSIYFIIRVINNYKKGDKENVI